MGRKVKAKTRDKGKLSWCSSIGWYMMDGGILSLIASFRDGIRGGGVYVPLENDEMFTIVSGTFLWRGFCNSNGLSFSQL